MNQNLGPQFDTFYHLTNRRKFKPNAKQVPNDNTFAMQQRSRPGLYVADDIEHWWNGSGYHRAYVAEIKVPRGVAQDERWGGEKFIPGEQMGQARVSRVMPVDAYAREKFHEPGWVEEYHNKAFDTGEPFKRNDWGTSARQDNVPADYHYDGPDVRDFTPEQHASHMQRLRAYRKGVE